MHQSQKMSMVFAGHLMNEVGKVVHTPRCWVDEALCRWVETDKRELLFMSLVTRELYSPGIIFAFVLCDLRTFVSFPFL